MRRASLTVVVYALVSMVAVPRGQGKRVITEKDLFAFTWSAGPQISPDGCGGNRTPIVCEPEEIGYTSFDGRNIPGWILKPPDFDATRNDPLILEIHGGPHGAYGNTDTHEFMWMGKKNAAYATP